MPGQILGEMEVQPAPGPERDAVLYGLTKRGFFSEINMLVSNLAYAMAAGEDLYLDDSGLVTRWSELLQPTLPMAAELRREQYRRVVVCHPKVDRALWDERVRSVKENCDAGLKVDLPAAGFHGTWMELLVRLSRDVFKPRADILATADRLQAELGLDQPFYAVHIRRGDKTTGYLKSNGVLRVEGAAVPFDAYAEAAATLAPGLRRVFVLSDDYREVAEAQAQHPQLELITLCTPEEQGYYQDDFLALRRDEQLRSLRRLIVEVLIAARSAAFIGLYRSNVSLMVAALHPHPDKCASVDQAKAWTLMT